MAPKAKDRYKLGPMANQDSALSALSAEERDCLLGASLLGLEDPAGLPVPAGAWASLRALPKAKRVALLAAWIAELQSPFPAGMERLHPSWVAEALAREPEDLWPALTIGLPNAAHVRACFPGKSIPEADSKAWQLDAVTEMQRFVFADLALMCVTPAGPIGARLCRLSCDELLAEVDRQGAEKLPEDLLREGDASLYAVVGRLPAKLGRGWLGGAGEGHQGKRPQGAAVAGMPSGGRPS
jgi:hypothetical protein